MQCKDCQHYVPDGKDNTGECLIAKRVKLPVWLETDVKYNIVDSTDTCDLGQPKHVSPPKGFVL